MIKSCKIIGITGGIGSGKSVISRILRLNGHFVFDCDFEAKELMNYDPYVKNCLINILGTKAYLPNGVINRAFIAANIFQNESKRKEVNLIVHKIVKNKFINSVLDLRLENAYIESAILMTSGFYTFCDEIWEVEATFETRLKRVMQRNQLSKEEVVERINSQQKESLCKDLKIKKILNNINDSILSKIIKISNNNKLISEECYVEENLVYNR